LIPETISTPSGPSLKSWRLTAQEALEDDATKRGSGSRTALAIAILTLAGSLLVSIYAQIHGAKGLEGTIKELIWGTVWLAAPYAVKQVAAAMDKKSPSPPTPADPGPLP
jgi:hypothetical protein